MDMLKITTTLSIPEEELTFAASRGSGPGGQHRNTTSTRVTLFFDVANSPFLTEDQKARILEKCASRISKEGVLRVSAQSARSQWTNKQQAIRRFVELLQHALHIPKVRKKRRVSLRAKQRRLEAKKKQAQKKHARAKVTSS